MSKQKMTPSEALVETLVAEGVETVFGIVGSAYMDALDLFPAAGIRFVSVAHEQAAAHAADGLARVTGRPQVCIGQNGPGAANFVSAITAAFWAHSPVVAITPETGSMGIGTGGFQELDQMPMFARSTVYQVRVNRPERMAELARRAFFMAKLENGPTQLNIPRDNFYGVCEDEIYATPRIGRGAGPRAALEEAARMARAAEYPVIVAGGGVSQGDALEEVVALAERLGAPVVNSYLHNDSFPAAHPLAAGPLGYCGSKAAMRIIAKADLVLALGSRLGPFGTLPQYEIDYWPRAARLIQVDRDAKVLGLSRRVDLPICAEVGDFTAELLQALEALDDANRAAEAGSTATSAARAEKAEARRRDVARERQIWEKELSGWSAARDEPMHPRALLQELARALPAGAIVATDIGNNASMANAYLKFDGVRQHLSALSWGNCGFAYGAALGAKVGRPEVPVVCFQGDGAYGISGIAEVMTAVREQIPVIAIVANNHEWGAEKKNQIDYYGNRFVGSELRQNPDFAELARVMGARGFRVTHRDQVGDALREALACGAPCVIDAVIRGGAEVLAEPFRRDALRLPERFLEKYAALRGESE